MITVITLITIIIILTFGLVVLVGAPYVPTLKKQQNLAIELMDLKPGQVMLELGSGDGRILKAAAKKGIRAIGYELNPLLVLFSYISCWHYRDLITIKMANFWVSPLPRCDAIYVFLHDKFMKKLDNKITREIKGPVRLVSFAFKIPGKKESTEVSGLYIYKYNNK